MSLASDIREVISYYPFSDMSAHVKGVVNRLADRADDLTEELRLYRQVFEAMNSAGLKGAKRLAKFRYEREQRTGPDHGEQVMVHFGGETFRCPDCGSNVFTKGVELDAEAKDFSSAQNVYICNGCQSTWKGEE